MTARPTSVEIGDDEPVTLAEACRLFFGGRIAPSALRTEAAKGNLVITQIARKDFVSRRDIEEMKARCRREGNRPASGSGPNRPPTVDAGSHGSSSTEPAMSAQDAARIRLRKLNDTLSNTSPPATRSPARVVPLRS